MHPPRILVNSDFVEAKRDRYEVPVSYFNALLREGAMPWLCPATDDAAVLGRYAEQADGFLFIGGADYPPALYGETPDPATKPVHARRAAADIVLAELALASGKPILAICAGHQLLHIVRGGRLIQHLDTGLAHTKEAYHPVRLEPASRLEHLLGGGDILVNSSHHQAARPGTVPTAFRVTATASDGVIEAMEGTGQAWIVSLQWHPERIREEAHRHALFAAFVQACSTSKGDV